LLSEPRQQGMLLGLGADIDPTTRLRDKINARRRDLPWVRVEKNYVFEGPNCPKTLADLFESRSQLFVKHFMFAPGWNSGCVGCSLDVDHIEGALEHHDVTCIAVSRATLPEIEAFKKRRPTDAVPKNWSARTCAWI
jgi:predicted dithiol-disulfide oxidoreductase (DUF899 family)